MGTFLDYQNNETAGKEPVSGELGKGTVTEPFDQGNDCEYSTPRIRHMGYR